MPSAEQSYQAADKHAKPRNSLWLRSSPADNGTRDIPAVQRQIPAQQKRTHAVPENKIRAVRVLVLYNARHLMHIRNCRF